jgi:predicted nucleic acid-binding protein
VERVLAGDDEIVVPALFPIEVGAALARAGEAPVPIATYVDTLLAVAATVVTIGPIRAHRIRDVALATRLRAADATYVWLATREAIPLCTLDRQMLQRGALACQVILP